MSREPTIPPKSGPLAGRGFFRDARMAASFVSIKHAAIIGQAKAMIDWHQRHGFCPRCGEPTKIMDAGYRRLCPKCNAEHFPRVDPVVIMLATEGEACLVGRGKQFPPGMFSALAGFVEPGETIEEAVRRELMEEASVKIGEVTYYATQPWPFPSSLMIGCFAKAESRAVKADENELAEVRWIERSVARELVAGSAGRRHPRAAADRHRASSDQNLGAGREVIARRSSINRGLPACASGSCDRRRESRPPRRDDR